MDTQQAVSSLATFTKVDDTSFTVTTTPAPVTQTFNLNQLLRQQAELTARIAARQADLDAINALIAHAQSNGIQTAQPVEAVKVA